MVKRTRQELILAILNENGFATAKELMLRTQYSSATIHRDLIELERKGLIKRSSGGAEVLDLGTCPPLPQRYDFHREEKLRICRAAAELIRDGETVFIASATTASYIPTYLTKKKDVHIITNNLAFALRSSQEGFKVTVLGGTVCERPSMLTGELTVENVMRFRVDKAFFSTVAFSSDGRISGGDTHHLVHRAMIARADKAYFLSCANKCTDDFKMDLCTFQQVDGVISDYAFSDETKQKFPTTTFIQV